MGYLIVCLAAFMAGFVTRGLLRRKSGKIQSSGGRTLSPGVKDKIIERIEKAEASNEKTDKLIDDINRLLGSDPPDSG